MSYFPSAREAARALGVPLLLRESPDPRAFRRHDWLGTLAAPAASAARMYALAVSEVSRSGAGAAGVGGGSLGSASAIWVTGPWGTMAHLPWAVGLADHLARTRGRAGLLEREADGPLRILARPGRRIAIHLPLAEALLGGPVDAVNTDLEGVSILLGRDEEERAGGGTANAAAGDFPLVLADGLPEALEGPYPGAEHVAGVILVASFRDHSRFELDAVVRRLRETGHRVLGLTAIGPEVSEAEEAAALRTEAEAEAGTEAEGVLPDIAPSSPMPSSAGRATAGPVPGTASPSVHASVPEAKPAREAAPRSTAERAPEMAPVAEPEAARTSVPVAAAGATTPRVDPVAEPEATTTALPAAAAGATSPRVDPVAEPEATTTALPAAAAAETTPRVDPAAAPGATTTASPASTAEASAEPGPGVPSARAEDRATISLLSTWDRMTIGRSRRRRRTAGVVVALLVLVAAAALYGVVLRPLLPSLHLPRSSGGESEVVPADGTDSVGTDAGTVVPAASDSTVPAAESTGTPGERIAPAGDSTATGEDTGSVAPDSGRARNEESGAGIVRPDPVPATDAAADSAIDSSAVRGRSSAFGTNEGAADTMVAFPGGAGDESRGTFVIHLTSFKFPAEAEIEVTALQQRGIEARSVRAEIPQRGTWYRIVTGKFATFAEAESVALRLQAEGKIPYAHIAADGGRGQPVPVGTLDRARP